MSSLGISREVLRRMLIVGARMVYEQMLKRKNRRCWVGTWILRRNDLRAARLSEEQQLEYPSSYANSLRMSVPKFKELLERETMFFSK